MGALFADLLYAVISSDDIADLLREKVIQALKGELAVVFMGDSGKEGLLGGNLRQPGNPSGGVPIQDALGRRVALRVTKVFGSRRVLFL